MYVNNSHFHEGNSQTSTTQPNKVGVIVVNPDGTNVGTPSPTPFYERIVLVAGGAGTSGAVQLSAFPIYNSTGTALNTSVDTSFNITLGTALTTQVATLAAVLANGDYYIDPYTGLVTYIKATADTIHEVNYLAGSENVSVNNFYDLSTIETVRNDYTITPVTTGAYVQLIAALSADVKEIEIFDSSGQTLALAVGAAAAEVNRCYVQPGGNGRIVEGFQAGDRISIIAISANATVGEISINLRA